MQELVLKRLGKPPDHLSPIQKAHHQLLDVTLCGMFLAYTQLSKALYIICQPDSKQWTDDYPSVWVDVCGFVDQSNRLSYVLFNFPGMARKRSRFSDLYELLRPITEYRNHLQHPERLRLIDNKRQPIGTLTWCYTPIDRSSLPVWKVAGMFAFTDMNIHWPLSLGQPDMMPIGNLTYGLGDDSELNISGIAKCIVTLPDRYLEALNTLRSSEDPRRS